ncbi:hypothetical protein SAMN05878494_2182 [Bacillus cereus]|nr:hypothetical protein SAMN05878494_2182 [Bacillus cereus]
MGDGLVGSLEIGLYAKENLIIMDFITNIRNKNSGQKVIRQLFFIVVNLNMYPM